MPVRVQEDLPDEYTGLSPEETDRRIAEAKRRLGARVVILGHHYQQDDVMKFADLRGDSFKLSRQASERDDAEFIVFCGVHFMAESADILSAPHQKVVLPDLNAGCSMADMADIEDVECCWEKLSGASPEKIVPITYINSAADLKEFCGKNDGVVCTSSNAAGVLEWAFSRADRALFFPDQHLGRNTAYKMGLNLGEMSVWDPASVSGGLSEDEMRRARLILWNGYCSVHQRFTPEQVASARRDDPSVKVLVHPECRFDVARMADYCGSTEYIIKTVNEAPPGSSWAIGTEIHLVHRLAGEHPDKRIVSLDPIVCVCTTMYRIDPPHLLWVLEGLVRGEVMNRVQVHPETAEWARRALNRMLEIT
jgi:quinolinate synthase